jgi:hypothetical protein
MLLDWIIFDFDNRSNSMKTTYSYSDKALETAFLTTKKKKDSSW